MLFGSLICFQSETEIASFNLKVVLKYFHSFTWEMRWTQVFPFWQNHCENLNLVRFKKPHICNSYLLFNLLWNSNKKMLTTVLGQQKCLALIKVTICSYNLDSASWSRWSCKAKVALLFLTSPVCFAWCVMWGCWHWGLGPGGSKQSPCIFCNSSCNERRGWGGRCLPPSLI